MPEAEEATPMMTTVLKPQRGFSEQEFSQRLAAAQRLMAEQGMDCLLLTTEPEVRYFSGYFTQFWQSPTRPWFLLVPAAGKPVAVIPEIGAPLMRNTWLDDVRSWSSPQPGDDGVSLLSATLRELCPQASARIGVMQGSESLLRMPLADFQQLQQGLPDMRWPDATPLIRQLRMVKSAEEIAKTRYICAVASASFAQAAELFSVGQPLEAVFRTFKISLLQQGADDVSYLVGGAGQGGYRDVISPPDGTPLQVGDVLMLDTGAVFDGYFCDFDRNFAFGRASAEANWAYDTLYAATEAGMAAARPGNTCAEVFWAMQRVITAAGGGEGGVGRMGHGLGMQLTEWPSHMAADPTVIQENMVLTLEPGLSLPDGRIMVHEENILVGTDSNEWLSQRAAAALPVIS